MAVEGFFGKIADDLERIATRFEEGLSVLLDGENNQDPTSQGTQEDSDVPKWDDLGDLDMDNLSDEEIEMLTQQAMSESSPLEGIADSVIGDIVSKQASPSTPMEHFHAFRSAVTWSEKFILCLVGFQICVFLLCLWTSRRGRGLTPRVCLMLFIGAVVRCAEILNGIGARNWEKFCSQNYFDKGGVFVGIMLCAPLLFDSLIILLLSLSEASHLLVQVKREEIQKKRKNKAAPKSAQKAVKGD